MKYFILGFLLLLNFSSCTKNKEDKQKNNIIVEGIDNISLRQIDTMVIPITIKNVDAASHPISLSVMNVPSPASSVELSSVDPSNNSATITIVTNGLDTGTINARVVVSTANEVIQQDFKIKVTSHPQLAIAGNYTQINNCVETEPINRQVKITASPNGLIFLENMNIHGYSAGTLIGSFDYIRNTIGLTFHEDSVGMFVGGLGVYKGNEIELSIDLTNNCKIILRR